MSDDIASIKGNGKGIGIALNIGRIDVHFDICMIFAVGCFLAGVGIKPF